MSDVLDVRTLVAGPTVEEALQVVATAAAKPVGHDVPHALLSLSPFFVGRPKLLSEFADSAGDRLPLLDIGSAVSPAMQHLVLGGLASLDDPLPSRGGELEGVAKPCEEDVQQAIGVLVDLSAGKVRDIQYRS